MRRIGPITILSLLVFAAPAAAKGVSQASVCGPSSCKEVEDERLLVAFMDAGTPSGPPGRAVTWYRARVQVDGEGGAHDTFTLVIVPKARKLLGEDGTWMSMLPEHVARYDEIVTNLDPYPATKLPGLDAPAPKARVVGTVRFAPPARVDDGGAFPWEWVGGGAAAALLAAGGVLVLRRRRRPGPTAPPAAEPTS